MGEKKKQKIYRIVMLVIVVALLTYIVTTVLTYDGSIRYIVSNKTMSSNSTSKRLDALLATVTELINEKYLGDVNEEKLIDGALRGLADSVGDDYTQYYSKEDLEEFTTQTLGSFVGIGIYMKANTEKDVVEVVEPIVGGPAEKVGLKAGDEILAVDGVEYKAKDSKEMSDHIKGEEGTDVKLKIRRGAEEFDVTVTRGNVHLKYVDSTILENNIGYIAISTFDQQCAVDFEAEYDKILADGAKSLIIDLRANGGGVVDEALAIADLICDKGQITLIKEDKDGKEQIIKSEKDPKINMPIVVLTNIGTASASEILASALSENGKAKLVGEKTFGKGVIQELIYLPNGGALKVTTSEYFTPNKNKINQVGISPDYEVSYDVTNLEKDEQLEKAIEVLKEKM